MNKTETLIEKLSEKTDVCDYDHLHGDCDVPILKCHVEKRIERMYGIATECGVEHLMNKLLKLNRLWLPCGFTRSLQGIAKKEDIRTCDCGVIEIYKPIHMSHPCRTHAWNVERELKPESQALIKFLASIFLPDESCEK